MNPEKREGKGQLFRGREQMQSMDCRINAKQNWERVKADNAVPTREKSSALMCIISCERKDCGRGKRTTWG